MKSEIESLTIKCSNHKKGCKWIGEMRDLSKHLQLDQGCNYFLVECPNKCLCVKLLRKNVSRHLNRRCELRNIYCSEAGVAKTFSNHKLTCDKYPMSCPKGCGEKGLIRCRLDAHQQTCNFEIILCEYAHVGCNKEVRRQDMPQHMVTFQGQHLEMMEKELKRVKLAVSQRDNVVRHELMLAEKSEFASQFYKEDWLHL